MYTTHSLSELQMTSRSPSLHIPRDTLHEFDRDALAQGLRDLEHSRARRNSRKVVGRLVHTVLERFAELIRQAKQSGAAPIPGDVSN